MSTTRRSGFVLLLAAAACLVGMMVSPATASDNGGAAAMRAFDRDLISSMNAFRQAHGLRPLRLSTRLTSSASQHSTEMAARGYFGHTSADGSRFDRRIARYYPANSRYWAVGENLLWSSPDVSAADALQMWEHSPEHRANLLAARWREIGIAAVHVGSAPGAYGGRPVTVVTADFGVRR